MPPPRLHFVDGDRSGGPDVVNKLLDVCLALPLNYPSNQRAKSAFDQPTSTQINAGQRFLRSGVRKTSGQLARVIRPTSRNFVFPPPVGFNRLAAIEQFRSGARSGFGDVFKIEKPQRSTYMKVERASSGSSKYVRRVERERQIIIIKRVITRRKLAWLRVITRETASRALTQLSIGAKPSAG